MVVVRQHAEDAAVLRNTRSSLVRAPHVRLHLLRRLDDRLAAQLDGLDVAGEHGRASANAALESPGKGQLFTAMVMAIEQSDIRGLQELLSLAEALPDAQAGAVSALGWVSAASLRGITGAMLDSGVAFRRQLALAACGMHRVDPGSALAVAANDADPRLRARAWRVAGERALTAHRDACLAGLDDENAWCRFEAARAAILLGERRRAVQVIEDFAAADSSPWREASLCLALLLRTPQQSAGLLRDLSRDPADARLLLRCVGIAGDPRHVPWLIDQMRTTKLARRAGESFSLLTGVDLAMGDLECRPPPDLEAETEDLPEGALGTTDEDESLPWPDVDRLEAWWHVHGQGFRAGFRHFLGSPPSAASFLDALKSAGQRQRALAALHLCLARAEMPLFNIAAPAWRQQRWLDALEA